MEKVPGGWLTGTPHFTCLTLSSVFLPQSQLNPERTLQSLLSPNLGGPEHRLPAINEAVSNLYPEPPGKSGAQTGSGLFPATVY